MHRHEPLGQILSVVWGEIQVLFGSNLVLGF
jgi:hypothetical protein